MIIFAQRNAALSLAALTFIAASPAVSQDSLEARAPSVLGRFADISSDDPAMSRRRLAHIQGGASDGWLLRSLGSLLSAGRLGEAPPAVFAWRTRVIHNTAMPFSVNDGPIWAARGLSVTTMPILSFALGRLHAVLAPELLVVANADWQVRDSSRFGSPGVPVERMGGGYAFPWYTGPYGADLPTRFGPDANRRIDPGQSSVHVNVAGFHFGAATENEWWGPGIRNALVISNNAPGFPHLFARSARPWRTRLGTLEWRWLVGGLRESAYFDTISTNNVRSISTAAVTLQPWRVKNLTVGAARSVMGTSTGWSEIPARWFEVFHGTGSINARAISDSVLQPGGREQILSLFGRYILPNTGSAYFEWARTQLPSSVRDFLVAPNHTQGYTLGFEWLRQFRTPDGRLRANVEVTNVEQSATFRHRPIGVWYTSSGVVQGYTNRGQPLGAAIGPGSSSQWLAFDYLKPAWSLGAYGGRIRWNEDVRSLFNWPSYQRYCTHDISLYGGIRGEKKTRWGFAALDAAVGKRYHVFFQNGAGCDGQNVKDVTNATISLTMGTAR